MSMTPEIASKIIDGMRVNLKQVILPQLKELPYPTGQAVSMYLLLKTLSGYTSPEFQEHIQKSNYEIREILLEVSSSFNMYFPAKNAEADTLRLEIQNVLENREHVKDIATEHQELMNNLVRLIKALWGGLEMKEEGKNILKAKVNTCLRKQLNREFELFT